MHVLMGKRRTYVIELEKNWVTVGQSKKSSHVKLPFYRRPLIALATYVAIYHSIICTIWCRLIIYYNIYRIIYPLSLLLRLKRQRGKERREAEGVKFRSKKCKRFPSPPIYTMDRSENESILSKGKKKQTYGLDCVYNGAWMDRRNVCCLF